MQPSWTRQSAMDYARAMERFAKYDYRPWAERIARHLSGRYPAPELGDIGCGPGFLSRELAPLLGAARVTLVDPTAAMLELAEEQLAGLGLPLRPLPSEAEAVDLPEQSLDVAVCKQLLHEAKDWRAVLAELRRLLRPGGTAVIIDFDARGSRLAARGIQTMIRLFAGEELARAFRRSFSHGLDRDEVRKEALRIGLAPVTATPHGPNYLVLAHRP